MLFSTGLSTTSAIALAVMAGIFIVFALLSSFVFPKRNPDFPGPRFRWVYVVACTGLFLLMMSTVIVFGKEDEEARAQETSTEHPGETSSTETTPAPTTTTGGTVTGDVAAGKIVFTQNPCGTCHTLKDAGSTGTVGPNLDEAKPSADVVRDRVEHGKGAMPPFPQITGDDLDNLVAYVVSATQSG
jgi:cytochrome c6